jgi:hypothetical protein
LTARPGITEKSASTRLNPVLIVVAAVETVAVAVVAANVVTKSLSFLKNPVLLPGFFAGICLNCYYCKISPLFSRQLPGFFKIF